MADHTPPPMATPRVAAGALFFDSQGRVLLVKPNYKDGWDVPGGYVEPDETPLQACKREVLEELGLDPDIGRLLVTDWAPNNGEGDKILFVFDGGILSPEQTAAITLDDDELSDWAFKERAELTTFLPPRLQRRISQAVEAWQAGQHIYLEHGTPPTQIRPEQTAWWTTEHVASYLGVSTSTVRAYLSRNQMPEPDIRAGQQRLWRPETIHRWHQARPRKATGQSA